MSRGPSPSKPASVDTVTEPWSRAPHDRDHPTPLILREGSLTATGCTPDGPAPLAQRRMPGSTPGVRAMRPARRQTLFVVALESANEHDHTVLPGEVERWISSYLRPGWNVYVRPYKRDAADA